MNAKSVFSTRLLSKLFNAHNWSEYMRLPYQGMKREIGYHRVTPTNLLPFLTYQCTSRCNTCSMWRRRTDQEEMTLTDWQSFFRSLQTMPNQTLRHVEFFGGDVLLRKDVLLPLIRQARDSGLHTAAPLNGILLNETIATELVEAGIHTIYISVDGVEEQHDTVRGIEGNFQRIRSGVAALRRARGNNDTPRVAAICTVSRYNAGNFEQVLPFVIDAGFDEVQFEYAGEFPPEACQQSGIEGVYPSPYFVSNNGSFLATHDQATRIHEQLASMRSSPAAREIDLITKNIDVLSPDNMVNGIFDVRRCYMSHLQVVIDPYGNVLACPFFHTYPLGNLREQSLSEIWNGERHQRFMHAQSTGQFPLCKHCILSVERNPTPWQMIRKTYVKQMKRLSAR